MNFKTLLSCLFLFSVLVSSSQEVDELTDSRDGQKYKIVTVDIVLEGDVTVKRTWMAQNLNFEVPDSFCYKMNPHTVKLTVDFILSKLRLQRVLKDGMSLLLVNGIYCSTHMWNS
jgi:hypothetical protein